MTFEIVAHVVQNPSTRRFRAVWQLPAKFRWCLTGTPVQNKLEDIGSLVKFLRITPFDRTGMFRRHIIEPLKTGRPDCLRNLRLLLGSICLRRLKCLLELPNTTTECRYLNLSLAEREEYISITEQSKVAIDDAVSRKETGKAYKSILQAILKLRLFCNHGTFKQPPVSNSEGSQPPELDETLALFQQSGDTACVYCGCEIVSLDGIEDGSSGFLTVCSHLICFRVLTTI